LLDKTKKRCSAFFAENEVLRPQNFSLKELSLWNSLM